MQLHVCTHLHEGTTLKTEVAESHAEVRGNLWAPVVEGPSRGRGAVWMLTLIERTVVGPSHTGYRIEILLFACTFMAGTRLYL